MITSIGSEWVSVMLTATGIDAAGIQEVRINWRASTDCKLPNDGPPIIGWVANRINPARALCRNWLMCLENRQRR